MDNSFVNLQMCQESEFFLGTMGSTWSVVSMGFDRRQAKRRRACVSQPQPVLARGTFIVQYSTVEY